MVSLRRLIGELNHFPPIRISGVEIDELIMPTPKGGHKKGHDQNRQRRLVCERSSSFPRESSAKRTTEKLRRLKTEPDLLRFSGVALGESFLPKRKLKLTKMLINVNIQGSVGPVHVVMPSESKVSDLIAASLQQYKKEGRRPILPTMDPSRFHLHYSQFCLESLQKEDKLVALDSRNFFLLPEKVSRRPPLWKNGDNWFKGDDERNQD